MAIILAWVLLFSNVGGPLICHAKASSQTEQEELEEENDILPDAEVSQEHAGAKILPAAAEAMTDRSERYKINRHLLSEGANYTTDEGDKAYSNIVDKKVTVDSIRAKGGKYAKCKPEGKVKEGIDKEHYYKLAFENKVGSYVNGGYYDNKGQHHGAVHMVEKFYKKYQVYSQVYSYTVTDDATMTVDYYYFIYIWWELIDDDYHKSSDADYLTYCLQYGVSISKDDTAYAKEKQTYDALTEKEKYKVACAIYYGPHREKGGQYYTTLKKKLNADSKGYDPSTWSRTMWHRYAATQFYIWTVTNSDKFSHGDAVATAKQFDKAYPTENESCYNFYVQLKAYAENAVRLPRFMSDDSKTTSKETLSLQTDGCYAVTLHDANAMIKTGTFSCDNSDVEIQVISDTELMLKSAKPVALANLTFQKKEQVPDANGLWYYANNKSQNMVDSIVSVTDCVGYLQLQTSDTDDTPLKVHKVGAATGKAYANAGYAVFTSWKSAAVYDPETKKTMVDEKGNTLKSSDYIAGLIYQTETGQPWNFTVYSEAKETELRKTGYNVKTVYHLAYYVKKGCTSNALPATYCITTDETGWAQTGKIKRRVVDGQDVTYYGYYMVEFQAPEHCEPAYPVKVENGSLTEGICCLKWNTPEEYNQSAKTQVDEEHTGGIKIYKYETGSMLPLKNVVFHIYEDAECTRLYREVTTGEDGYAYADQMAPGTYYVKEKYGQGIHVKDQSVTEVQISSDELTVIDKSNTPITVRIHLQKKADGTLFPEGFSPEDYSVAGAEYTLYAAEDIIGSNGTVLFHKDDLVYTMVCDDSGYAQVPMKFAQEHLRLGSYYVKETKAPYGYELDNTKYLVEAWNPEAAVSEATEAKVSEADVDRDEFTEENSVYNIWVDVAAEKPVTKSIRLHKTANNTDCQGNWSTGDLEGAIFSVYCVDKMAADGLEVTKDNYKMIPFIDGEYDAYRAIICEDGANVHQMVTDAKGVAETSKLLAGNYVVVECKAPAGYDLTAPIWVSLPEDADEDYAYVEAVDQMLTGTITISKVGDLPVQTQTQDTAFGTVHQLVFEKRALAGVEFVIYDENLQAIQRVTTRSDGQAVTGELPLGTYYVQESKTLHGLVLDQQYYTARITEGNKHEIIDAYVKLQNDVMQAEVAIYKEGEMVVPSPDGAFSIATGPLEGVTFGVYNKTDIFSADGSLLLPAATLMGIATTNEEGEALLTGKLLPGTYYYQELRTLEGYVIDSRRYEFSLSLTSNQPIERIEVNRESPVMNYFYNAAVRLHKVDGTNASVRLEGVEFALYDAQTNECVGYYTTDKNGEIKIDRMPFGSWYFKETKPLKGYQVDTTQYTFTISETGNAIDLVVKNYPTIDLGYKESSKVGVVFTIGIVFVVCGLILGVVKRKRRK